MNKIILAVTACALVSASVLCGCSSDNNNADAIIGERNTDNRPSYHIYHDIDEHDEDENHDDHYFDDSAEFRNPNARRSPISGVRIRRKRSPAGNYYSEYIYSPDTTAVEDSAASVYSLQLNKDNTFNMDISVNDSKYELNGHWYSKCDRIVMYNDENGNAETTDFPILISNVTYGELYPHGKIMLYDNNNLIVLSRDTTMYNR